MAELPSNVTKLTPARASGPAVRVFTADRDSEAMIRQALGESGAGEAQYTQGTVVNAISALAQAASSKLLIVDLSGVDDPIKRIHELADVCEPSTGVLAIGDRNDIILYRDLKRAGIAEYFFKPLVVDLVARACKAILTGNVEDIAPRTGRLVFVLGVRGGNGATTIAANTAWYLAETRQRWVMLVDLDLQRGDAALQLDVSPSHALREACEHPERVDQLFLERGVIHVTQKFDLLASLDRMGDHAAASDDAVVTLLDNLAQRYRFVFVDLPPELALKMPKVLGLRGTYVLVTDGSLTAARDLARWRQLIGGGNERMALHVLNKHGAPGSLPDDDFARAAGQAPDILIPYDRSIATASNFGVKATQKVGALKLGLAPLIQQLSGDRVEVRQSLMRRVFG